VGWVVADGDEGVVAGPLQVGDGVVDKERLVERDTLLVAPIEDESVAVEVAGEIEEAAMRLAEGEWPRVVDETECEEARIRAEIAAVQSTPEVEATDLVWWGAEPGVASQVCAPYFALPPSATVLQGFSRPEGDVERVGFALFGSHAPGAVPPEERRRPVTDVQSPGIQSDGQNVEKCRGCDAVEDKPGQASGKTASSGPHGSEYSHRCGQ